MPQSSDVIVIGAGVIGAAVAFELSKTGRKVLVVDRLPASGYGSTSSSAAVVRCHYSTIEGASLAWESYHVWKDWSSYVGDRDERGTIHFLENGCLNFKDESNAFLEPVCEVMDEVGIPYQHWDIKTIAQRMPFLDLRRFGPPKTPNDPSFGKPGTGTIPGGVYFPNAGYVSDPQLAAHNLQIAAENAGARFIFNTEVTEICLHEGRVQGLKIADGELFNAPVVVNVGGPNSNQINNMAGVTKGMRIANRPLKKEMCYLPAPANIGFSEDVPFFADPDIGSFCRPEVGGKLLTVSMEPKCDELTWVEDANNYDRNFTDQWTTQALRLGIRMPSLGIPGQASGIVDLYDVSTDWIPIYDVSDVKGYFMACGTSGNQFKNAPLAGAIITALIEATELGHNHDTDPVQLFLPRTGNTLNLGAFSRRRKINEESSLSVMG